MPKISDLPADTAPASTDLIPFVDVDAARTESVTVANLAASAAFAGQYAPLDAQIAQHFASATPSFPANNASAATVTYTVQASPTISGGFTRYLRSADDECFAFVGGVPSYDAATFRTSLNSAGNPNSPWGIEFDFYGAEFEILLRALGGSPLFWVWVDGVPVQAAPEAPGAIGPSAGTQFNMHVDLGSVGHRRILVLGCQFQFRYIDTTSNIYTLRRPSRPRLRVAVVSDSFAGGANGASVFDAFAAQLRAFDVDVYVSGQGGTGYVQDGAGLTAPFADESRLAEVVAYDPELVVFMGSVNDDGDAGIQAAATSAYAYIATNLPNVPVVVFGPQGTASTTTYAADRLSNLAAVKAAAEAAPNVIGFVDMIGATSSTAAWVSGTTYAVGDVVTNGGATWRRISAGAGTTAPNSDNQDVWRMISVLNGTGQVGTTASDGNRDLYLSNDGLHPSVVGHAVLARYVASEVQRTLAT